MAPTASADLQLMIALGIPKARAAFALSEFGDVETATDWCFAEGSDWTPQSLLQTRHAPPPDPFAHSSADATPESYGAPLDLAPNRKVPPHRSIKPGVNVAIVLKEDQSTGRETLGVVGDVLTRGDHPRGVKVRLRDGKVGRVQRLT